MREHGQKVLRAWLDLHKPRLGQGGQLFLAEMMWTLVGSGLLTVGMIWVLQRYGGFGLTYAVIFACLGLVKAVMILDRVARRAVERIAVRGRDYCAGGFFSPQSWLLVLGMMALGQILRRTPVPRADIGFLYIAVGTALIVSSRTIWRRWWRLRSGDATPA